MRKISTRIKRILTSNLGLKIVSVLVACMMWIFVVNVDDPEKVLSFSDVKVEIRNSDCFGVDFLGVHMNIVLLSSLKKKALVAESSIHRPV